MKVKTTMLAMITMLAMLFASPMVSATEEGVTDADRAVLTTIGATATVMADAVPVVAIGGGVVYALTNANEYPADCPKSVYDAPMVKARHKGESGYAFEVTACDFKLNRDRLVKFE